MRHFFAYGTLMCEDIMTEVSGLYPSHIPGILRGYRRVNVRGEHYPALAPDEEACVEGVVYLNVSQSAWDRLDRFEGDMYSRENVQVERNDGSGLKADTYVTKAEFITRLSEVDWDFDEFLRKNKGSFRRFYKGYRDVK